MMDWFCLPNDAPSMMSGAFAFTPNLCPPDLNPVRIGLLCVNQGSVDRLFGNVFVGLGGLTLSETSVLFAKSSSDETNGGSPLANLFHHLSLHLPDVLTSDWYYIGIGLALS